MKDCPNCGISNPPDSKFCPQCGTRLVPPGDTTHIIPIIDDDPMRAEVDVTGESATVLPGTALLIATRGLSSGVSYVLDQPETTAGRSSTCDILLDDITVSRKHVTFALEDGVVTLTDHGSLNGTYVNRQVITSPTVLANRDEVQIGKFKMMILTDGTGSR